MGKLIRLVLPLLLLGAAALPSPAGAELIGVCGKDLCAATEAGKLTKLTSDGAAGAYASPSASRDGAVLGYLRAGEPFLGGPRGKGAESLLDTDDGRTIRVSADGESLITRTFDSRVGIFGYQLQSNLRIAGAIGSRLYSSSVNVFVAGFVGDGGLAVTPAPVSEDGSVICTVALIPSDELPPCGPVIAAQPGRTLTEFSLSPDGKLLAAESATCDAAFKCGDPSLVLFNTASGAVVRELFRGAGSRPEFSPDGRQVAFSVGADTLVVPVAGGAPKPLVKGMTDATWAATAEPGLATRKLKLKGTKLAVRAKCATVGGCAAAVWTLKPRGRPNTILGRFAVPALAGKAAKRVQETLPSGFVAQIKAAGGAGLQLQLLGVGGKKRPTEVTAVG